MKKVISFLGAKLVVLSFCSFVLRGSQEKTQNGYVMFVGDESVIFIPAKNPKPNVDLADLQKEVGLDIKGYLPNKLKKLREGGTNYNVSIRLIDKNGTAEMSNYVITVVPVAIDYDAKPSSKIDTLAVPFIYKEKSYLVNYVFNYDLIVSDIKPTFKKRKHKGKAL